jgi:hypothetical protein
MCDGPDLIASTKRMVALWRVYGMNMGSGQCVLYSVTENHSGKATVIAPLTTAVAALQTNISSARLVGAVVRRGVTAMYVAVAERPLSRLRRAYRNHSSRSLVSTVDRLTLGDHLQYLVDRHDLLRRQY